MRPSGFISTWDGVELWRAGAHDVPADAVPCTLPAENTLAAWDMFRSELRANCKRLVATLDDRSYCNLRADLLQNSAALFGAAL